MEQNPEEVRLAVAQQLGHHQLIESDLRNDNAGLRYEVHALRYEFYPLSVGGVRLVFRNSYVDEVACEFFYLLGGELHFIGKVADLQLTDLSEVDRLIVECLDRFPMPPTFNWRRSYSMPPMTWFISREEEAKKSLQFAESVLFVASDDLVNEIIARMISFVMRRAPERRPYWSRLEHVCKERGVLDQFVVLKDRIEKNFLAAQAFV